MNEQINLRRTVPGSRFRRPNKSLPKRPVHPLIAALRAHRISLGLTQVELAELAGYSVRMIEAWEQGREQPLLLSFVDVCDVAGLDITLTVRGQNAKSN